MYRFEEKLRDRVAPFVEVLEAEGYDASVFHPSEHGIKVSISKDGDAVGPVVVYYKPSEDAFSISDHEMEDAGAFEHFESMFYESEETEVLPGYHAYVDGSYRNERIGYGWVIYKDGVVQHKDFGTASSFENMRQVVGELKATVEALNWCESNGVKSVYLHYDYEGIEKWPSGEWKTKNACTKRYRSLVDQCPVDINWVKEDAHTGVSGNEHADRLAKKGAEPPRSDGKSEEVEDSIDPIDELKTTIDEFLKFAGDADIPEGIELEPKQLYNGQFFRLEIIRENRVSGRFDLYNTANKHLEPRLHGFQTKKLKGRVQALWDEFCGRYVSPDEAAIRAVDHLYGIFEPYREHVRIDMIDLARAIEDAYAVIEDRSVSLEDCRLDFEALEEHVDHLRSAASLSSSTSNT